MFCSSPSKGFILIVLGIALRWRWVRNFPFRLLHLLAILAVTASLWLGRICPLTTWENSLRKAGGGAAYTGGFIHHWLQKLFFSILPPGFSSSPIRSSAGSSSWRGSWHHLKGGDESQRCCHYFLNQPGAARTTEVSIWRGEIVQYFLRRRSFSSSVTMRKPCFS